MIKHLLLDVSGTLLYKPSLYDNLINVLYNSGIKIDLQTLQYNHKLLSETIKFPDRTDETFYRYFNTELLFSLGIVPSDNLLQEIFNSCTYLPWEKYDDTSVLNELNVPMSILSNFNSSLENKLNLFFGPIFNTFFVSEVIGSAKPSKDFYQYALKQLNVEPKEILYIGDSFKLDFKPAYELGFTTFIIDREDFYKNNKNTITSLFEIKNLL